MLSKCNMIASILWICLVCQAASFSPQHGRGAVVTPSSSVRERSMTYLSASSQNTDHSSVQSRREWTRDAFSALIATAGSTAFLGMSAPAVADGGDTIFKTGKAPIVPGQKPKDKGDVKGTKKDPSFLRSVADCKGKCENSPGPDGLARSSAECLSACQDICCTTYEQCTFAIVPRL